MQCHRLFFHRFPALPCLSTLLALVLFPQLARAGTESPEPALPSPEELELRGAVIGEIRVQVGDIFDPALPEEDRRLFRMANLLLIRPGDLYSRRRIEESERLLRAAHYFYNPEIRVVRYDGEKVDLEVVTRDLWTLKGGAGVGRSGGTNSTHFKLQDTNFLGTGKSLNLERSSNVDRTSSLFHFQDPNVLGSRTRLGLDYASNSDGSLRSFQLERPFYSFESRWAGGITAISDDRVDSLYQLGHATDRFRHRQELLELYGGLAQGGTGERVHRWTAGFTFLRDRFSIVGSSASPAARTLAFPWIGFDSLGDQFLTTRNVDQIGRTEDFALGGRFHTRLGVSSPLFGGDRDEAVFDATASWGWRPESHPALTFLLSGEGGGRWGNEGRRHVRLGSQAKLYWRNFGDQLFLVSLQGDVLQHRDPETQLLLGGDNGLRGYPLRYQDGDSRFLLTLEQRVFTDWYPFRLLRVGGAVFFDAGRSWFGDEAAESGAPNVRNLGVLKDIGLGLRFGSSRSALGSVVHFDLAFPLDGDRSIDRIQYLVTTKTGF
jgi:hypothetical protein